jgi:Protein of unknown function (DUF3175)
MAKRKRKPTKRATKSQYWSQNVTETSDALTLEEGVFKKPTPRAVALSLKRSADASHRRKSAPFRSAMSMLVFFINRAGKGLSKSEKEKLEKAKDELRALYGKNTGRKGKKKQSKRKAKKKAKRKSPKRRAG